MHQRPRSSRARALCFCSSRRRKRTRPSARGSALDCHQGRGPHADRPRPQGGVGPDLHLARLSSAPAACACLASRSTGRVSSGRRPRRTGCHRQGVVRPGRPARLAPAPRQPGWQPQSSGAGRFGVTPPGRGAPAALALQSAPASQRSTAGAKRSSGGCWAIAANSASILRCRSLSCSYLRHRRASSRRRRSAGFRRSHSLRHW